MGLIVPDDIKQKFIEDSRIKPGAIPFNKGKKQDEWVGEDSLKRMKAGRFQKGHKPSHAAKTLQISKLYFKPDGKHYLYIYLGVKKRMPLQRYLWEQDHGPVPKGHKITFKDGNTLNCNLDNLELISNAALMARNTAQRFGIEIFKIIQLRGALNRKINNLLKQLSNEK